MQLNLKKYIVRSDDSFIRYDKQSNKYVPVRDVKYATQWEDRSKAVNIMSSMRSNQKTRFWVEEYDVGSCQLTDEDITKWYDSIGTFLEFSDNAVHKRELLNNRLSMADKEISDLYHYIEFTDRLNAYQGWLLFKMLQDALRMRRKVKRELEVITKICDGNGQPIIDRIRDGENQTYHPRVLHDLFRRKELKNETC